MPSWEGAPLAPTDARLAAAGVSIGPDTATPEWYGESLDLTATLDVLWEPRRPSRSAVPDRAAPRAATEAFNALYDASKQMVFSSDRFERGRNVAGQAPQRDPRPAWQ